MASIPAANSFPDPVELEAAISDVEIRPNLTVTDAAMALQATPARFSIYEDVEDLGIKTSESADARELADAMLPIRNAIADELRSRDLLVAVEIIDHLLFNALTGADGRPAVQAVVEALRRARVGEAGLIVFAVHSLGLTADDLGSLLGRTGVEIIEPLWGIAITPQTNSLEATIHFLDRVSAAFGIQGSVRRESIQHLRRSRQTRWLELNPLLIVRVSEAAGTYFGNEAMLLTRLQTATVLVSMLAALQPVSHRTGRPALSTYVNRHDIDLPAVVDLTGRVLGRPGEVDDDLPQGGRLASDVAAGQRRVAQVHDRPLDDHGGMQRRLRRADGGRAHPEVALHRRPRRQVRPVDVIGLQRRTPQEPGDRMTGAAGSRVTFRAASERRDRGQRRADATRRDPPLAVQTRQGACGSLGSQNTAIGGQRKSGARSDSSGGALRAMSPA